MADNFNLLDIGNNNARTLLNVTGQTTSILGAVNTNRNFKGCIFYLNVTAVPGVDTIQGQFNGIDPESGNAILIAVTPAIVGVTITELNIYPGITPIAGIAVSSTFPFKWRFDVAHSGVGAFDYTVSVSELI